MNKSQEMKIYENYKDSDRWNAIKGIAFVIQVEPKKYTAENVPPLKKTGIFAHFDDEKIVMQLCSDKKASMGSNNLFVWGAVFIFIGTLVLPRIMDLDFESPSVIAAFLWAMIPGSFGIYWWIKALKYPDYVYLTFYRHSGLVELPVDEESANTVIVKFNDLKANIGSMTTLNYHSGPELRFYRGESPGFHFTKYHEFITMSWSNNPMEYWSLYVWYMDRNRPLPPGTAFDPYRQKDYERRKAEGFPPPLYESKIPTPEWTPGSEGSIVNNLN